MNKSAQILTATSATNLKQHTELKHLTHLGKYLVNDDQNIFYLKKMEDMNTNLGTVNLLQNSNCEL